MATTIFRNASRLALWKGGSRLQTQACFRLQSPASVCLNRSYSTTAKTHPRYYDAQKHLADAEPEKAIEAFKEVVKDEPENIQAMTTLALVLQHYDVEEAEALFEKCSRLGADTDSSFAGIYAYFLYTVADNIDRAEEMFEKAMRDVDVKEVVVFNYADFLENQGRVDEARVQYERALEMDPEKARTHCNYANLLSQHFALGDLAEKHFQKAFEFEEFDFMTHVLYARFLSKKHKDREPALEYLSKAMAIDTLSAVPLIYEFIHEFYPKKQRTALFDEIVEDWIDNPFTAYYNYACYAIDMQNDHSTAEYYFKKAVAIDVDDCGMTRNYYAEVCIRYAVFCINEMRQVATAEQMLEKALTSGGPELHPDVVKAIKGLLKDPKDD